MTLRSATKPVEAARAQRYREEKLWDDRPLGRGLAEAVAVRGGALAVGDAGRCVSFTEFALRVATSARSMWASGVRAGDGVLLVVGNTIEGVVAYHALLRLGALAVLLDRRCGESDLEYACACLGRVPMIMIPESERERLSVAKRGNVVSLEEICAPAPNVSSEHLPEPPRDVPAVVLFTSGTTGRPKGVVHSLHTLTAGAANMASIVGADRQTVIFLASPLASITGVMQLHLAADQGATLILEDRFDPAGSLDRINRTGATLLGGAPVLAERLLRSAIERSAPISLTTLALGGAMLPRPLLDLATNQFGMTIARVYGSSEAPNFSGSLREDGTERRLGDDGSLMAGSEIRVGSNAHRLEGLVRGPSVFLGYLDPRDNADAFEGEWFRTGDLVEVEEGRLTVVGRIKEIVNRNGLKVSLAEIDRALSDLADVLESSAFCVADPDTGERLAVAVVPKGGASITLDDVVGHLVARGVARRKLPEQLTLWDAPLPRTASGKVIRAHLAMEAPAKHSQFAARLFEG